MRTFVIGSKELSVKILITLIKQGHEVLGVFSRDEEPSMHIWHKALNHRSLKAEAEKRGIPAHEGMKVNSLEAKTLLRSLDLDIVFSCFWSEIFKQETLDIPKLGIFNFHTAYLPWNRGSRPIPWALIEGEDFTGMTIHKMNPGIDDGPIVSQTKVKIEGSDTAKTLYDKVINAGIQLFESTLPKFADGSYGLESQDNSRSTYHPRGEPFGCQINHHWSDDKKDRFRRAFDFIPFRKHREAPESLDPIRGPQVWYLIESSLPALSLPPNESTWKQNNIGNKEERAEIKGHFNSLSGKGLFIDQSLEGMYPIHDILIQLGIEFVVSKTYSKIVTPFDIIALHPHRYENGLLEIPAIHLNPETDLSDLFVQSRKGLTELKNDLFVGLISPNTEQIEVISQQIEKFGGGVLTFTQVYRHFNTEYETITP